MKPLLRLVLCALVFEPGASVALFSSRLAFAESIQVIAVSGQAIPGTNSIFSTNFFTPFLNDNGQIAFENWHSGGLPSSPVDQDRLFLVDTSGIHQVADASQFAPDGTIVHSTLHLQQLSNNGQLVFSWVLNQANGQSAPDFGEFAGDQNSLVQLARYGQVAPDGNGTIFRLGGFGINNGYNSSGQFAFFAELLGTTGDPLNNWAIFRKDGNQLTQIGRAGLSGPGGSTIASVSRLTPAINESGQVAFRATLVGGSGPSLLISDGTTITKLATYGQLSPRGDGVVLLMPSFAFNNAGQAAFFTYDAADLNDNLTWSHAVFRAEAGGLYEVARAGDPVPGGNGVFDYFYTGSYAGNVKPVLSDAGQIAFMSYISGSASGTADDQALILSGSDGATLKLIAREGQLAPDGNGHLQFPSVSLTSLNNLGQLAYLAAFTGTLGGTSDDGAILFWNGDHTITIAREGASLLGSQIKSLAGFQLNNAGQIAFRFSLADGREGIALWSVPEPSTLLLAVGIFALLAAYRRRRG